MDCRCCGWWGSSSSIYWVCGLIAWTDIAIEDVTVSWDCKTYEISSLINITSPDSSISINKVGSTYEITWFSSADDSDKLVAVKLWDTPWYLENKIVSTCNDILTITPTFVSGQWVLDLCVDIDDIWWGDWWWTTMNNEWVIVADDGSWDFTTIAGAINSWHEIIYVKGYHVINGQISLSNLPFGQGRLKIIWTKPDTRITITNSGSIYDPYWKWDITVENITLEITRTTNSPIFRQNINQTGKMCMIRDCSILEWGVSTNDSYIMTGWSQGSWVYNSRFIVNWTGHLPISWATEQVTISDCTYICWEHKLDTNTLRITIYWNWFNTYIYASSWSLHTSNDEATMNNCHFVMDGRMSWVIWARLNNCSIIDNDAFAHSISFWGGANWLKITALTGMWIVLSWYEKNYTNLDISVVGNIYIDNTIVSNSFISVQAQIWMWWVAWLIWNYIHWPQINVNSSDNIITGNLCFTPADIPVSWNNNIVCNNQAWTITNSWTWNVIANNK